MKYTDHLGNEFDNLKDMCSFYNVSYANFKYRMSTGWSLKKALTTPTKIRSKECADHLGNSYPSVKDMCEHYGIEYPVFKSRMKLGYGLEKSLTLPCQHRKKGCQDHLGNKYNTVIEMCKHYGMEVSTFQSRVSKGKSLEEALTAPISDRGIGKMCEGKDGKQFKSIAEMCRYYDIPYSTFSNRLEAGRTTDEAISGVFEHGNKKPCVDHLGKSWESISEMCRHYRIAVSTFSYRVKAGKPLDECLSPGKPKFRKKRKKGSKAKSQEENKENQDIDIEPEEE